MLVLKEHKAEGTSLSAILSNTYLNMKTFKSIRALGEEVPQEHFLRKSV
jgi:hypothetical protein